MRRILAAAALAAAVLATAGCSRLLAVPSPSASGTVPAFRHVVIVVEENHGAAAAMSMPYLSELRRDGMTFTDAHGVAHPSQPNYVALWSGSTHGIGSDACPQDLGSTPSLGSQLLGAGRTVAAYAEDLPAAGSAVCRSGAYARKHDPLADFAATAGAAHDLPFSAFPHRYDALPAVSLVVPNLDHDGHDGTLTAADGWLRANLGGYAAWARSHDSLLIVTFDEDEGTQANRILTVFTGAHVRAGASSQRIDHVGVLHTVERSFGLAPLGDPADPITDVWR